MPTSVSAKKRLRQSLDRRAKNRSVRSAVRTQIKKVRKAIEEKNLEACAEQFKLACKKLDQAAAKKVIHANAAARTKSRLSKAILAVKQAA